jgi:signal transduction histidine kinase
MTTWYAGAGLVLILGTAVGVAVLFGRRIDHALRDATQAAGAIAKGEVIDARRSGLHEADELLDVLHAAGAELQRESAARARLEAERERLLATERDARLHAEAQDRAKDNFISMLSHELRNPLAAITSAVAVIQLPTMPAQNRERAWEIVNRQLAHFTRMVGDLLDLRRVLSGTVTLEKQRVNLGELVTFCCDSKCVTDTKDHEWIVSTADAWTTGDRTRLTQVVDNLLTNAIKYTPAGGTITARVYVDGPWAVVDISDTGVGIAADVLPTVFESLVQGPTTIDRSQGGLGLGLSIARGLIAMHGGTISAESGGHGEGSRFVVRVPANGDGNATPTGPMTVP